METQINNPLIIRCKNCGGELGFDIVKQQYVCAHCGTTTEQVSRKAEFKEWQSTHQRNLQQQLSQAKLFCCPACGAKTMTAVDDVTTKCPFCGNTLIDDTLSETELPEIIIPFKVTLEEAKDKLKQWINENSKHSAAQMIKQHLNRLTGCYLPYQIVRGANNGHLFIAKMTGVDTSHPFKAYLDSTAINASKEFDNLLLDGMEPFLFEDAKEFDFSYLNGQKAKIKNIDGKELNLRIDEEIKAQLFQTLSKKLLNRRLSLFLLDNDNESASALLPVYFMNCGNGIEAAVNGQTGKISIITGKTTKPSRFWWILPTIIATIATATAIIYKEFVFVPYILTIFGTSFLIEADNRKWRHPVKEILTVPKTRQSHNKTRLQFFVEKESEMELKKTLKPVSWAYVVLEHLFAK